MGRNKIRKTKCVVCGFNREFAYQGDTGAVCTTCAAVESGQRPPENVGIPLFKQRQAPSGTAEAMANMVKYGMQAITLVSDELMPKGETDREAEATKHSRMVDGFTHWSSPGWDEANKRILSILTFDPGCPRCKEVEGLK